MPLNHVALTVRDRERSAAFYAEHFGLSARIHEDERRLIVGDAQGSLLALSEGEPAAAGLPHTNHFGFQLAHGDEVRAARERFRTAGVSETEWQDDAGFVRVQVEDPDGYRVELYGYSPTMQLGVIRIVRGGRERIDDLRPLWESLSEHHAEIAPHLQELGPVRPPAESWRVRRALYEEWLAEPGAFVLVAEDDGRPVGYALVHLRGPEETWATGDQIAELETLAVLPAHRGKGIGAALMGRFYEELRSAGIRHWGVAVISSNADAVRFYERQGLVPFTRSYLGPVPN
jgi:ribosomal protein S18 acetylase RimI-like enzyme/predicted enzyme related to lactoylglutathione lyase